jgi:hypothetical protein
LKNLPFLPVCFLELVPSRLPFLPLLRCHRRCGSEVKLRDGTGGRVRMRKRQQNCKNCCNPENPCPSVAPHGLPFNGRFTVAFRWRRRLLDGRTITVNHFDLDAFMIFDADRFPFNILDAYAPSVPAFHQLHCCRAAFSRLGRLIKSQPRNLLFLLSELHLVCSRTSTRDTGLCGKSGSLNL